jgi:hypothetical protein
MFLVLAVLVWSVLLGLLARRFGPLEEMLLLAGIAAAVAVQYFVFGPS